GGNGADGGTGGNGGSGSQGEESNGGDGGDGGDAGDGGLCGAGGNGGSTTINSDGDVDIDGTISAVAGIGGVGGDGGVGDGFGNGGIGNPTPENDGLDGAPGADGQNQPDCEAGTVGSNTINYCDTANVDTDGADIDPPATENADSDLCKVCEVKVDKKISCDGGDNYVDDNGVVLANEDGTDPPCIGWSPFDDMPGEQILVEYYAQNTGDVNLFNCELCDDNTALGVNCVDIGDLPAGGGVVLIHVVDTVCSDEDPDLDFMEPDTATITCGCDEDSTPGGEGEFTSAYDEADFECQTPELCVNKDCEDADQDGISAVTVDVANPGEADLINCTASDGLYLEDMTCPADEGGATDVPLVPPTFDLPMGDPCTDDTQCMNPDIPVCVDCDGDGTNDTCGSRLTGSTPPLVDVTVANEASVTCDIVDSGDPLKTITADDCDECLGCTPDITIVKTAGLTEEDQVPDGEQLKLDADANGDYPPVVYQYVVCNTGTCALINMIVTDDNGTPGDPTDDFTVQVPGPLKPDECTTVYSDPIPISGPLDCLTPHVNDACVTGEAPDGSTVEDCDDAEVCSNCTPDITIVKTAGDAPDGEVLKLSANPDGSYDPVVFHYEVCNTGTCDLSNVVVTDDNGTPGDPTDDFTVNVGNLAVGQCLTVDSAPIAIPGPLDCQTPRVNNACATGDSSDGGTAGPACDDAVVCSNCDPDITIVKTAGDAPDGEVLKLSANPDGSYDPVVFHYEVCNTGTCDLTNVVVTDDNGTPTDTSDDFT
ncbi:MAG: hypothetical protein IIA44_13025, partial [Acidobacteria bacterium]|nr:hypothetical protein [Acidobacteriota bacterium]